MTYVFVLYLLCSGVALPIVVPVFMKKIKKLQIRNMELQKGVDTKCN